MRELIARLRRRAAKVPEGTMLRLQMTAEEAEYLANCADGLGAVLAHLGRRPRTSDFGTLEEYHDEHEIWEDVLYDWGQGS